MHGTGSTVRVVLFDYRKAFDLIDHALLARKLLALDMSAGVSFWIIDFLTDRTQRVKLGEDCLSEWRNVPAGVPQGTKLGPWLFILMIDDINTSNTELWKYVDDTTIVYCCLLFCLLKNCTNQIKSNYLNSHGEEAQEKPPGLQGMGSLS